MKKLLLSLFLATTAFAAEPDPFDQSDVALEVDTNDAKLTKIVLLAGSPSNKSGQHEYFAGCALMAKWLKQTPGVWPVIARDGWPQNEAIFKGAKCVVYYGDGGGKQPFLAPEHWPVFSKLMEQGTGLVLLHQAVDFPADRDEAKAWIGGVYHSDIGSRGHWDMDFPSIPEHAVTRGVKPVQILGDGYLFNVHFAEGAKPLIAGQVPDKARSTADAKSHAGRDEVIGWAFERPSGGRGFGFTGCDLHRNWELESQRKLVVNGILWSAGLEIPKDGAPVEFDRADLARHLDKKAAPAPAKAAPAAN